MKIKKCSEFIKESLPQSKSVEQLKMVRKISKGTDIGDKVSDIEQKGANLDYMRNVVDSDIETYQDYISNNKDFDMENPLNNQKKGPHISYAVPQMKKSYPDEK